MIRMRISNEEESNNAEDKLPYWVTRRWSCSACEQLLLLTVMPCFSFQPMKPGAPTRLADFDGLPSWRDLASKIRELLNIASDHDVHVMFFEEAKEPVILTGEQELQHFYKSFKSSGGFKFIVQEFQVVECLKCWNS